MIPRRKLQLSIMILVVLLICVLMFYVAAKKLNLPL